MAILSYGQVGWRSASVAPAAASTLWTSVFGVWNADTLGTSLDSSIFRVYNGDNVNDTSGNAQNGTNVGSVTFTTGKVGNAFTFNGSNYIQLPDNSLNSLTGDFSISFWIYPVANDGAYRTIISTYNNNAGSDYGWELDVQAGVQPYFSLYGTSTVTLQRGNTFNLNQWNHFVLTRKTSTGTKMYHNGELVIQNTSTVNQRFHTTMFASIGALKYGVSSVSQYQGNSNKIDALTVWNKELTANEVFNLYNDGTGAEYPFTSQTLASLKDSVGSNDGTRPASTLTGGVPGPSFTTGKIGKAFLFDGINDYVELPNNIMKFSNTDNWSISFWIYANVTGYSVVIGNNDYSGGQGTGWAIRTWTTAGGDPSKFSIQFFTNWVNGSGTPSNVLQTDGTASVNTWNHFVITRNSSEQEKIYQNGTLVASQTNPSTKLIYPATSYSCIGANRYQSNIGAYAKAGSKIDAMSVWNKELSASEVTELYNSGNGKQHPY